VGVIQRRMAARLLRGLGRAQALFTIGHNMMISLAGLVKACLPFSRKHAQANAVAWRRFYELHH